MKIIPYENEKDLEDILLTYDIQKRFIGEEYRQNDFTGKQIGVDKGIESDEIPF